MNPLQERKPLLVEIQLLRSERRIERLRAEIERHIREKVELAGMLAKARDEIERLRAGNEQALFNLPREQRPSTFPDSLVNARENEK